MISVYKMKADGPVQVGTIDNGQMQGDVKLLEVLADELTDKSIEADWISTYSRGSYLWVVQDGEHMPNQKSALTAYLQENSTMNDTLRLAAKGWQPAIDVMQTMGDFLDEMDSAIRKGSLKEEKTVYKSFSDMDWYGLDIGDVIEDAGYTSVMSDKMEKSGIVTEIKLSANQNFVAGDTNELILPRHTKLRVIEKLESRLVMEVVP